MGDIELQVFSDRLKILRNNLDITQKDFAEKIGITAAALSSYENNLKNPSIAVAKRIAETFNVSIDWLCGLSTNQFINKTYIQTYTDIVKICLDNNITHPIKAMENITSNFSKNINAFIDGLKHMEKLKWEQTIDQELYDLWLEKELKKLNYSIACGYDEKIKDPFTGEIQENPYINKMPTDLTPP